MKLLEEHIGENPHYFELNKKFSDVTIKYDPKKETLVNWSLSKLKSFGVPRRD